MQKQLIKRIVDLAMLALLPFMMMEILIGQEIHEWLGVGMLALFIIHHILNFGWWKNFYKGTYTPSRALGTALDLLLFFDMAALGASGIMMSGFVFDFLPISGGMILARQLHLFASHWGLILMPAHLGMHLKLLMGMGRSLLHLSEKNTARIWTLRIAAVGICGYGIYAFFAQHILDYLFLQTHFVLFDETKAPTAYFAEIAAMIGAAAVIAYCLDKLLRKTSSGSEKEGGPGWKIVSFAVPALVCVLATAGLAMPAQNMPWQSLPAQPPAGSLAGGSSQEENMQNLTEQTPISEQTAAAETEDGASFSFRAAALQWAARRMNRGARRTKRSTP